MLLFRRYSAEGSSRIKALRELYWKSAGENRPEARGLRLLRGWLSPEQRAQLDAKRYFDVIGCDSGKRYRIRYGIAMNVNELDGAGRPKICWCFVPEGHLVVGDVMLAQKIALETKESSALAVANPFRPKVEPVAPRMRY
jgi:hypothetical protein